MADNFLERQREIYEERKAKWLKKKHRVPRKSRNIERPEDEAL